MWFSLPNMRRRWGDAAALAVARAAEDSVAEIGEFCERQGVDAWFRRAGYLQVSTAPAHDAAWAEALSACRELGAADAIEPLSPAQVAARCASPAFRAGAFYPGAATVQPARLALGLRARVLTAGVEAYESSPVRSLRDCPGGVEARTPGGAVRARTALLAIGGAATAPHAPLRNRLTIASSHIVLTEPVPDLLEEVGWTGGECITDSRALIDYFRTTPDGRILFGWGGGRIAIGARLGGRSELDPDVLARTAPHLHDYFRGLKGRRLTHAWGGPIDASSTHLPMVVPLPGGNAFAAAGYTGNGVGPSHMVARTLASLALDRRDAPSRLPFVDPAPPRVPPEPFSWIGAEAIRAGIIHKEAAELANRRPNPTSSLLARVPDLIGFHIGR
jgi:glycine/D-amino acid oxidase-like deaminating enzyme